MGLDNGIEIRKNKRTEELKLDAKFSVLYSDKYLEICYWRKCCGLRNCIVNYLETNHKFMIDEGLWKLDVEDINFIIETLEYFNNKRVWNEEGRSIWEWKNYKKIIRRNINDLHYILAKMEDFPNDFEITFYDSY